ncbi:MAG: hypothetical protein KC505_10380 [Myxococcales bacterium]|nr:hypothetical protein [Myxococcales bacterium]USN50407.1 MAG: hypothetical protein H6731_09110 [Myxococcales bacterium]
MNKKQALPIVHFISGKGGVGKSICSKALATYFARNNYKTLLVELSEEDSEEYKESAKVEKIEQNLSVTKICPNQSLYQYFRLKIPAQALVDKIFSKNFFKLLCTAMPGLSDLTRLGKIWFHADSEKGSQTEHFDKIIVDLPSSGFIARFLSVARVVREVVKIGPLAKEAGLIEKFFKNPDNAVLHLVTLPQELAINESFEIYSDIKRMHDISLGLLFINRCTAMAADDLKFLETHLDDQMKANAMIVQFFLSQVEYEERQRARLNELGLAMPQLILSEHYGVFDEREIMDDVVKSLTEYFGS